MRSCEKMTQLISESLDRPLTRVEKFEKSFHTFMCKGCRNYEENAHKLRQFTQMHKNYKGNQKK